MRLFGEEAGHPGIYLERAWAEEEWSRGGPVCSPAPGALSAYGEALRRPSGRIHWAGAETATIWCGYMDGRGALGRAGGGGGARRRGLALIVGARMEVNELSEARDIDVAFAGAARQAEMVRAKEVSPRELVELYLERIERIDPGLNAYRTVFGERALAEADEAGKRLGGSGEAPLLGVPVAIKDNVDYAGEITAHGTAAYGAPAAEDSHVVRKLREAGAIVIGKTNLPELAIYGFTESPTWGDTRNPWDPSRTCGGSSGGSGVATAAGLCAIAHATDGAGSIRYPSAYCGLFGLKPQRNRVSLTPDREHWHGLSVSGCVSRSVIDTALYLDAIARLGTRRLRFAAAARSPPGRGGEDAPGQAEDRLHHEDDPPGAQGR